MKYHLLGGAKTEADKAFEIKYNEAMETYPIAEGDEIVEVVYCCDSDFTISEKDADKDFTCPKCNKVYPVGS